MGMLEPVQFGVVGGLLFVGTNHNNRILGRHNRPRVPRLYLHLACDRRGRADDGLAVFGGGDVKRVWVEVIVSTAAHCSVTSPANSDLMTSVFFVQTLTISPPQAVAVFPT